MKRAIAPLWIAWLGAACSAEQRARPSRSEPRWLDVGRDGLQRDAHADRPRSVDRGVEQRAAPRHEGDRGVARPAARSGSATAARVEIDGLPGEYVVLDKTHRRWTRRVDLFMGKDVRKALKWGKRKMRIRCVESLRRREASRASAPARRRSRPAPGCIRELRILALHELGQLHRGTRRAPTTRACSPPRTPSAAADSARASARTAADTRARTARSACRRSPSGFRAALRRARASAIENSFRSGCSSTTFRKSW